MGAAEQKPRLKTLIRASQSWPHVPSSRIYSSQEAARVWHVRESALAPWFLSPASLTRLEGWEDAAVRLLNWAPICAPSLP